MLPTMTRGPLLGPPPPGPLHRRRGVDQAAVEVAQQRGRRAATPPSASSEDDEVGGVAGRGVRRVARRPGPRPPRRPGPTSPGRSSSARTTSRQNIVDDTQAEPRPSAASATSRFSTPAPAATRNISRSARCPPGVGVVVRAVGDEARDHEVRRRAQHVAAPEPPADLLVGEAVAPEVLGPGRGHRVEQPGAGRRRPRASTNRHGRRVVRRGRGDGGRHGAEHVRPVHRLVGEVAHGAAGDGTTSRCPSRNMSSSAGRTSAAAPGPSSSVTRCSRPVTTATGTRASLPLTSSAAAATSSATAVTVMASSRPSGSSRPRWSSRGRGRPRRSPGR